MNLITASREALLERLRTINTDNGYRTDAGRNVRFGWFNEVLQAGDIAFPCIVLQKTKGKPPEAGPGAIKHFPGYHVIGAVDVGLDDYDAAVEALELDLLQCLVPEHGQFTRWLPRGATGLSLGAPETYPPGNGERAACVLLPVYLHLVTQAWRPAGQ